ncbi:hypothetical protein QYE76_067958 [Lolium multiflorum]|uniref:Reverse transcriptase domain-containing protein n=1 Tax=Lolium multiflorum TaxID=4521 RepID=A0AAD8SEI1_LOLMU|nr:hypothetical protein QYE76_067958 [Lolium multiflorum]
MAGVAESPEEPHGSCRRPPGLSPCGTPSTGRRCGGAGRAASHLTRLTGYSENAYSFSMVLFEMIIDKEPLGDKYLVLPVCQAISPHCSLSAETSLGSDHTPLVFDTGEGFPLRTNRFFFETSWFERQDFVPLVQHKWENLLTKIAHLDVLADSSGLDEDAWASRYHLEEQLLHIYRMEEEHWRQRGRVRWALQGDANTAYFHVVANGRRRKCNIARLSSDNGTITDPKLIQQHIYEFYRNLLSASAPRVCGLAPSAWGEEARVSDEENVGLECTFSEDELEAIVKDMKTDTAPGPDGFPMVFFKRFWPQVKHGILQLLNDFMLGRIDIARINFGILSLIPKVPGAELISQYRLIALINVIFKIISKAYASKLDPVAHRILSPNQTAFIKGRNILDGPLALMEIIHDIRVRMHNGVLLKLDFEKAYDRVNWDFLGEVLRCKGFDEGYIHMIAQLVSGGQTAISINVGAKHEVRNGRRTSFWKDWWTGRGPIMESFPSLFAVCDNQDISVAEALHHNALQVRFRRSFDQENLRLWGELQGLVNQVPLDTDLDKVSWHLEQSGSDSVKSMYAQLSQGVTVAHHKDMWKSKVPLKINIFSWHLALDKLPSGQQILTRHGPSNGLCALCGAPEDASHIFFDCSLAKFAWSVSRQLLGCNWCPANFPQFHAILSGFSGYARKLLWVLFLAQSWALWNTRNKLAIEKKVISNPADIIYKIILLLQLWSIKFKSRENEGLKWMARELRELYVQLKPPTP